MNLYQNFFFYYLLSILVLPFFSAQGQYLPRSYKPEKLREKKIPGVMKITTYYGEIVKTYGSGFFISKEGYFVTNMHVLSDLLNSAYRFEFLLGSGEKLKDVQFIRCSDKREIDLCLLKTSLKPKTWFRPTGEKVPLGQKIFKIGNSDNRDFHMTSGITVSRQESVPFLMDYYYQKNWDVEFIEVQAGIRPGDSGGPIFDQWGDLIGMSTLKIDQQLSAHSRQLAISSVEIYKYVQDILNGVKVPSQYSIPLKD